MVHCWYVKARLAKEVGKEVTRYNSRYITLRAQQENVS